MAQSFNSTLLRLRQVLSETGDSRSWLYQRIQDKRFPAPVKCGGVSKRPAREVDAMNEAQISSKTDDEIRRLVKDLVSRRTAGAGQ